MVEVPHQHVEIFDRPAHVRRVEPQRLSQFPQHAHEIDHEADALAGAAGVHVRAIHPCDGLQQDVVAHRLVEVQAIEKRRVVARQQLVGDDKNVRGGVRFLESAAHLCFALRRYLKLGHQRAVDDVGGVVGVDGHGPVGGQVPVQGALVLGAGFAVDADQERLVAEWRHVLPEMIGDEGGDLANAVVGRQEGAQPDGAVEHPVELVHVRDALHLRQGEELLIEPLGGHRHAAGRQGVANRQRGFVLNRLRNGVLVQIAQVVVDPENLEGALAVLGTGNRRAGKADDRGVGHRGHQVGAEVLGHRAVRLVDEHVDGVAGIGVRLDALELVDHGQDQAAPVGLEQGLEVGSGIRPPDRNVLVLHVAEQAFHPVLELPFELRSIHHHDHRR